MSPFCGSQVQVTAEERSLAAALRWQDELTSRGCLPASNRAQKPLLSLASFDPGQLTFQQRADGKLLSAAMSAAAAAAASHTKATIPTSSPQLTEQSVAVATASADEQTEDTAMPSREGQGTSVTITQTCSAPSINAYDLQHTPVESSDEAVLHCDPDRCRPSPDSMQRQPSQETAQLARLPSAKGHCLSSYPAARPQSPTKHLTNAGDMLNGLQASKMLSVRPFSMQSQRPSTAVSSSETAAAQAGAVAVSERSDIQHSSNGAVSLSGQPLSVSDKATPPATVQPVSQPSSMIASAKAMSQEASTGTGETGYSPQTLLWANHKT